MLSFSDGSTSTLSDGRKLPQSQARSKGVPCPSPSSSAWASPTECDRRRGRGAGEIAANFSVQQIACKTLALGGFPAECQCCPSRSVIKLLLFSISIRAHSHPLGSRRGEHYSLCAHQEPDPVQPVHWRCTPRIRSQRTSSPQCTPKNRPGSACAHEVHTKNQTWF